MAKTKKNGARGKNPIFNMALTEKRYDITEFLENGRAMIEEDQGFAFTTATEFMLHIIRTHPQYKEWAESRRAVPA